MVAKVSSALKNLRNREIKAKDGQEDLSKIMVTCVKDAWYLKGVSDPEKRKPGPFASKSRLFKGVAWVANTTRGTNKYIDCTHLIYLYEQNMNPFIKSWLGVDVEFNDRYALTELIQWVYRSRVRRGEPVVLYLPSKRMRGLIEEWLNLKGAAEEQSGNILLAA